MTVAPECDLQWRRAATGVLAVAALERFPHAFLAGWDFHRFQVAFPTLRAHFGAGFEVKLVGRVGKHHRPDVAAFHHQIAELRQRALMVHAAPGVLRESAAIVETLSVTRGSRIALPGYFPSINMRTCPSTTSKLSLIR